MSPPRTGELRRDPVTGKWTILAPGRGARPTDRGAPGLEPASACPFCAGNETLTPPEIVALRPDGGGADGPGWTARVVSNKFPVLPGGHEVVIHTPEHVTRLADLPIERIADVVGLWQERSAAHCAAGAAAVSVVVNEGLEAGASLAHTHSQLFVTPVVPPVVVEELRNFALYRTKYGGCLLCDMMATARDRRTHSVFGGPIEAWVPEAARFPYELWLAPRDHAADFGGAAASVVAGALKRALTALAAASRGAALNIWLHTTPCREGGSFHWHFEAAPRMSTLAGFELATDMAINQVDPEVAAAELRAALPSA